MDLEFVRRFLRSCALVDCAVLLFNLTPRLVLTLLR